MKQPAQRNWATGGVATPGRNGTTTVSTPWPAAWQSHTECLSIAGPRTRDAIRRNREARNARPK